MGGDHAPEAELDAVAQLAHGRSDSRSPIAVTLVGDEARLREGLRRRKVQPADNLTIRHASQVVGMDESPASAVRGKRDSSMRVAFELVRSGQADAVVSAGNSGAMLACGMLLWKRLPGAARPAIVAKLPTLKTDVVLCDSGANVDVQPAVLAQFGVLGSAFAQATQGKPRPRLGLLANGSEEGKGTELTRGAHEILRRLGERGGNFEYVGYVEGRDLFGGDVDVVATDGFTGNVVLKTAEGAAGALVAFLRSAFRSSSRAKVAGILARPALRTFKQRIDYAETGGAPLLGIDGLALVCHGASNATALRNAIRAAARYAEQGLVARVTEALDRARVATADAADAGDAEEAKESKGTA
jgi:glycerol-3-phosphate acyltransferase PlsX